MTPEERQRLFEIRCRSKRGMKITDEEFKFVQSMFIFYPDEYSQDNRKVFEATSPSSMFNQEIVNDR